MVLGVLADPRVAVVDVRLEDVLIDYLGHHDEPLRQKVRLISTTQLHRSKHISIQSSTDQYKISQKYNKYRIDKRKYMN